MSRFSSTDTAFMKQALELARKGLGKVSPNPLVGCMVVKKGRVVATGYHKAYGSDHAEVDALKKLSGKAKGATVYVTLEPCHHVGKTPPCVDAVIRAGVGRVVVAMKDPNPLTAGKSLSKLRRAGIAVTLGVCKEEALELNRGFVSVMTQKRPYVIAKVAQSLDGKISTQKGQRGWITGKEAKRYVQLLRKGCDAVLVGRGTVGIDDPLLTVRTSQVFQPKRVVLDTHLRLSLKSKVFQAPGEVWVFCGAAVSAKRVEVFEKQGARVFTLRTNAKGEVPVSQVLKKLAACGVNTVLVEGGQKVFSSFYRSRLVDEWQVITAPFWVGECGYAAFEESVRPRFVVRSVQTLGEDVLACCVRG